MAKIKLIRELPSPALLFCNFKGVPCHLIWTSFKLVDLHDIDENKNWSLNATQRHLSVNLLHSHLFQALHLQHTVC